MVTRMEEAVQVLKDSKHFIVDRSTVSTSTATRQRMLFAQGSAPTMTDVDGLDHQRLRGLVARAFTPKYIQSLRPSIQQIADTLLDQVEGQGSMDLVENYAFPLPINVISDMLGVPHDNWNLLREGSRALIDQAGGLMVGTMDEQTTIEQGEKVRAYFDYVGLLVAEKRHHPQEDLISQLVQIEEEGDRLSEDELFSTIGLLILAGHETTSNFIGNAVLTLLDHPDQLAKLKANLSLVPTAVEELLRFCGPVLSGVPRFATEDIELGGQHIAKGDLLLVELPSANHDESQFTNSQELDLTRSLNRHIAFGNGIHVCLGAPLARLEGDIALTTLLRRIPNLRLTVPRESITWRIDALNLRGITSLPVAF